MTNSRVLRLFFDYVDPASYLLERRLRQLENRLEFGLVPVPFELIPPPTPMLDPRDPIWVQHWAAMAAEGWELGVDLKPPGIVPWTRKAHELARLSDKEGCFQEIHDTLYRAYLTEGLDIGRVDVLVDLGRRKGLAPMDMKVALDVDVHREWVLNRREEGLTAGIRRPPALVLGGRRLEGYPDDRTLTDFLAEGPREEP